MNRLKILREEKGLTQKDIAKIIGVKTSQAVGYYERGKRDMPTKTVQTLANFFGVSSDYLLGNSNKKNSDNNNLNNLLIIPILGRIPAGKPILANENIINHIPISTDMFSVKEDSDLFFLEVSGESMNKIIQNGAYVLVKKQEVAENGDIVVAIANDDDEATLKRYKVIDKQFIMLEPESSDETFEPIVINLKTSKFKIIGKAIGSYIEY